MACELIYDYGAYSSGIFWVMDQVEIPFEITWNPCFKNCGWMHCQSGSFRKSRITNFTFKWNVTFMDCVFKLYFLEKVALLISHLNGFIPSWTSAECIFKIDFKVKEVLQMSHLNGFFPSSGLHELWLNALSMWIF